MARSAACESIRGGARSGAPRAKMSSWSGPRGGGGEAGSKPMRVQGRSIWRVAPGASVSVMTRKVVGAARLRVRMVSGWMENWGDAGAGDAMESAKNWRTVNVRERDDAEMGMFEVARRGGAEVTDDRSLRRKGLLVLTVFGAQRLFPDKVVAPS